MSSIVITAMGLIVLAVTIFANSPDVREWREERKRRKQAKEKGGFLQNQLQWKLFRLMEILATRGRTVTGQRCTFYMGFLYAEGQVVPIQVKYENSREGASVIIQRRGNVVFDAFVKKLAGSELLVPRAYVPEFWQPCLQRLAANL